MPSQFNQRRQGRAPFRETARDLLMLAAVAGVGRYIQQRLSQPAPATTAPQSQAPQPQPDQSLRQSQSASTPQRGLTPSTAPNASFSEGGGTAGFDSPPVTSSQLPNPAIDREEDTP